MRARTAAPSQRRRSLSCVERERAILRRPVERFSALRDELEDNFEAAVVPSESAKSSHPHSVLNLVDEAGHTTIAARGRVPAFFRKRMNTDIDAAAAPSPAV